MSIHVAIRVADGTLLGFTCQGADYHVSDVVACWVVGDEVGYRVVADRQTFDLRGDPASLAWSLDSVSERVEAAPD
jgi:hypothetical protein